MKVHEEVCDSRSLLKINWAVETLLLSSVITTQFTSLQGYTSVRGEKFDFLITDFYPFFSNRLSG